MAVTIQSNGKVKEDQYWLIKSSSKWQRTMLGSDGRDRVVQPVMLSACDLRLYQSAPQMHKRLCDWGVFEVMEEQVHGRRVNDEVELFAMGEAGKETPGLSADMEAMGLTVRSYVAQSDKAKFPSRGLAFNKEKTFLAKCQETMHHAVVKYEIDNDDPIPYAILADPGTETKYNAKHLLVIIFHQPHFEEIVRNEEQIFTANECKYKSVGYYHNGQTTFNDDEVAKNFFTKHGTHIDVQFYNHVKRQEAEAKEAEKKEKKVAKKHRRQQTASSITTGSRTDSFNTELDDVIDPEAEARAQVKKEEERAKKKAYAARKKAIKKTETEQALTLSRAVDGKGDEEKKDRGLSRSHERESGSDVISEVSDDERVDEKVERLLGTEDSSSNESDESADALRVVQVADLAGGKRAAAEAKGSVIVMAQADYDLQGGAYGTGIKV